MRLLAQQGLRVDEHLLVALGARDEPVAQHLGEHDRPRGGDPVDAPLAKDGPDPLVWTESEHRAPCHELTDGVQL